MIMRRIFLCLFMCFVASAISAQTPVRDYYTNMVNRLKPYFENSDTVYFRSLNGEFRPCDSIADAIKGEAGVNFRINEIECLSNLVDWSRLYSDEIFFIHLSRGLLGLGEDITVTGPSCCWQYHKILTKREFSEIEQFWKDNESILTPDLLQDAIFSKLRALNNVTRISWYDTLLNKLNKKRMAERIAYRKTRSVEKVDTACTMDYYWNETKFKMLHDYFLKTDGKWFFDALTPPIEIQELIYYAKRQMGLDPYIPGTPVARKELEDIADWMFVNHKSFYCLWNYDLYFDWLDVIDADVE